MGAEIERLVHLHLGKLATLDFVYRLQGRVLQDLYEFKLTHYEVMRNMELATDEEKKRQLAEFYSKTKKSLQG